jgi:hypothetical protein
MLPVETVVCATRCSGGDTSTAARAKAKRRKSFPVEEVRHLNIFYPL